MMPLLANLNSQCSNVFVDKIVLKKEIDISVLKQGFTIPRETTDVFGFFNGSYLKPGDSKQIVIIFNNNPYTVQVRNTDFNEKNRQIHPNDAIQIRYNVQSDFAKSLRTIFHSSWEYLNKKWSEKRQIGDRKRVYLPEPLKEYLAIYSTPNEGVFIAEPILTDDISNLKKYFSPYPEQQIEAILEDNIKDPKAGYKERVVLTKFRKLNASISSRLKELYEFRCQICGQVVGQPYGVHTCECHHIDYFSKSWNNDTSNQLILCPNHHRAIHSADPVFNRRILQYEFRNGFIEKITLNKHLIPS